MSLSRAKNIFTPANINSIVILHGTTLHMRRVYEGVCRIACCHKLLKNQIDVESICYVTIGQGGKDIPFHS